MTPRLSEEKWYALSESERSIWDQLDDKAKGIILGIGNQSLQPNARFHGKNSEPAVKMEANIHDISAFDFL